jgi:hypothetical protein
MKIIIAALLTCQLAMPVNVWTAHFDNTRQAVNNLETSLTPTNVAARFGLLKTWTLDAQISTQPLYVVGVAGHNLVIASTEGNTIYAEDAVTFAQVWSINLGASYTTLGIASTPVIDVVNGWLFVAYVVSVGGNPQFFISKISLATGADLADRVITATYAGTGAGTVGSCTDTTSGGNVVFNAAWERQRAPLTLANGNVYIGFGSNGTEQACVFHGWELSYDEATLTQQAAFCTSPNSQGAGIWSSGGGAAVDGSGNLYISTGNGSAANGTSEYTQSVLKLSPSLAVMAHYTPSNWATTSTADQDVASGRVMLMGTNQLTIATKESVARILSTVDLSLVQSFSVPGQTYGGLFFQNAAYLQADGGGLASFAYGGSTYTTTASATTSGNYRYDSGWSASSNAGTNPIVWGYATNTAGTAADLIALNATTLAVIYDSGVIGGGGQFASPTIADGRVYVTNRAGQMLAFGLLPNAGIRGSSKIRGAAILR